jgi:hypothetical protein
MGRTEPPPRGYQPGRRMDNPRPPASGGAGSQGSRVEHHCPGCRCGEPQDEEIISSLIGEGAG